MGDKTIKPTIQEIKNSMREQWLKDNPNLKWVTTTNAKEWRVLEDTNDRKTNDKNYVIESNKVIECKSRIW